MIPRTGARGARTAVGGVALLGLVGLAFQIVARATRPLGNSDVFWQVRAGEIALATGQVPATDPFSYTVHGDPWNNHEWLFEILAALLHRSFGWGALRLLVLVCWGGAALGLAIHVARRAGLGPALLVTVLFHLLAGYKQKPVPQTLSMPLLLGALVLFRGPALLTSRRRAAGLVVYLLVWGNLTAEAITFLPFLLLDQIALRLGRPPGAAPDPRRRVVALLLVLAALAPLVNPPWSSVIDYAIRGSAVNRLVNVEFTPLWAPAAVVTPLAKLAARGVVVAFAAFAFVRLRRKRHVWASLQALGPGILSVLGALFLERDLWLLVIPAAQMISALSRRARIPVAASATIAGLLMAWVYSGEIGWSAAVAWKSVRDPAYRAAHIDAERIPVGCFDALSGVPGVRLYTLRLWASYAIWRLPEARVFYDGRNLEYGVEIFEAGSRVWRGAPDAAAILDATRTNRVVARPDWIDLPGLRGAPWAPVFTGAGCATFARRE